jgi:coniferyl-aldehyde dehydrogenase
MVARWYPSLASEDYTSIIDSSAYLRLTELLDQAQSVGAELVSLMPGPSRDPVSHRLAPHLVIGPPPDAAILADEIFGPILPVLPYDDVETVIQTIQRQPRPLAFYPFTHDRHALAGALQRVQCGGVSVNDTIFHVTQDGLPFGGIGESGMGHDHGRAGFDNFSKAKPVFLQSRFPVTGLIRPPYGSRVEAILRWFRS